MQALGPKDTRKGFLFSRQYVNMVLYPDWVQAASCRKRPPHRSPKEELSYVFGNGYLQLDPAIVIALIVTFLPITLPFKIVLAMVAMACFYFGRKYYHNHKNGGAETPSMSSAESEALASGILKALGGKNNIVKVDYCATRLRFEVHSYASVDEAAAKAAGAEGVIRPAKNACQVVIKGDVQAVYDALRKQL